MDMESDKGDCDAGKEDKSVNNNGCTACLKTTKLDHFGLPWKLKQYSRGQYNEQNHRH